MTEALAPLGPDALAEATVLTPTRRAGRDLADAFLAVSGAGAVLLPQMRALGDLDEGEPPFEPGELALDLPPAISASRRRYELARLVADHQDALGRTLDAAGALELADALAGFLDSVEIEEAAPLALIDGLAPEALARHWQVSAEFLKRGAGGVASAAGDARADGRRRAARGAAAGARRALDRGAARSCGGRRRLDRQPAGGRRPADRDRRRCRRARWCCRGSTSASPRAPGARSASSIRRAG